MAIVEELMGGWCSQACVSSCCHYWFRKRESKFWFPIILPQHGIRKEEGF